MSTAIEALEVTQPIVYQDYSQDRKAEVLALLDANDGNLKRTALEAGIPHQTIQYWRNQANRYTEFRPQVTENLANRFESTAHICLDLALGKAKDAPFSALMTGAAIAVDKMQLLRNLPTNVNLNIDLNGHDLSEILMGALSDAQADDDAITVNVTPQDK